YERHAVDRDHGIRRGEIAARQRGLDEAGHGCFAGLRLVDHVEPVVGRDLHSTATTATATTTRTATDSATATATTCSESRVDHNEGRKDRGGDKRDSARGHDRHL